MIDIEPIGQNGFALNCPHCQKQLAAITAHRWQATCDNYLYSDGDTLGVFTYLSPAQRRGGWAATLNVGNCPFCTKPFFSVVLKFTDAEAPEDVADTYFRDNGDQGEPSYFRARKGKLAWFVARHDTPIGPMLTHEFGPLIDDFGDWIGANGVAVCATGGPWEFARAFALSLWDELQAMPKGVGLDPCDPRALARPLPLGAKPRSFPATVDIEDDDVPF